MPSTPTTKSQVQAYRFVLRRMESALVRGDAVMLHDPMRTQLRAVAVGFFVAMLALGGFAVYARLTGGGTDLTRHQIVTNSGAVYVVVNGNDGPALVPALNLASARLYYAAVTQKYEVVSPVEVSDDSIGGPHKLPQVGIPNAPLTLPSPNDRIPAHWAVCDHTEPNPALPASAEPKPTTTVLAGVPQGVPQPGRPLGDNEALLVRTETGTLFLVFKGHRARIVDSSGRVSNALGLSELTPRLVSAALLDAIPPGADLQVPRIPSSSSPGPPQLSDLPVGSVFTVSSATAGAEFYVVLPDGIQPITPLLADLLGGVRKQGVPLRQIDGVPRRSVIPTGAYPSMRPQVVSEDASHTICLDWSFVEGKQLTAVTVAPGDVPSPVPPTPLTQAGGAGSRVDAAYIFRNGAAVRSIVEGQNPRTGTIFVVSSTGTVYGVPDDCTARILGLGDTFEPAPKSILQLLPPGPALNEEALGLPPLPPGACGNG